MNPDLQLAEQLLTKGQHQQAYLIFQAYLKKYPECSQAFYGLARCLQVKKCYLEAIDIYRRILTLDSSLSGVWNDLGLVYLECYRLKEAQQAFEQSLRLNRTIETYSNLARLYFFQGKISQAINIQYQGMALETESSINPYQSNYLFMLRADPTMSEQERFDAFKLKQKILDEAHRIRKNTSQKLNIGYLSPDFKKHSVSVIFKPLFQYHNRETFNIFAYSDSPLEDERTQFFKKYSDHWYQTAHWSDAQLAQQIRLNEIDILVDLAGHSAGNRLRVFSQRLASVQVSGLGLCCTTGLNTIDYLLADAHVIPPKLVKFTTEKVHYLSSFLYWEPPQDAVKLGEPPCLSRGYITFGCGNEVFKLNEKVIELWAEILQTVPDSRLLLKARAFKAQVVQDRYLELFEKLGVSSSRIQFQGPTNRLEHLEFYNSIDIALDPFPYQGGSSTCETLWMGVPCIALEGGTRTSDSLLKQVGMDGFVVKSKVDYLKLAKKLSLNSVELNNYKANLRYQVTQAAFMNGVQFCQSIERAYKIW